MLRFLGAFFIPPALASILLVAFVSVTGNLTLSDLPITIFSFTFRTVFATAIPSIVYFLILEKIYESNEKIRNSWIRFSLVGMAVGTIFGGAIGVYLQGITFFLNLGWIVGFVTAYAIFPKKTREVQPGASHNAGKPAS